MLKMVVRNKGKAIPKLQKYSVERTFGVIIQHEAYVHSPYLPLHTHHLLSLSPPSSFLLLRKILQTQVYTRKQWRTFSLLQYPDLLS